MEMMTTMREAMGEEDHRQLLAKVDGSIRSGCRRITPSIKIGSLRLGSASPDSLPSTAVQTRRRTSPSSALDPSGFRNLYLSTSSPRLRYLILQNSTFLHGSTGIPRLWFREASGVPFARRRRWAGRASSTVHVESAGWRDQSTSSAAATPVLAVQGAWSAGTKGSSPNSLEIFVAPFLSSSVIEAAARHRFFRTCASSLPKDSERSNSRLTFGFSTTPPTTVNDAITTRQFGVNTPGISRTDGSPLCPTRSSVTLGTASATPATSLARHGSLSATTCTSRRTRRRWISTRRRYAAILGPKMRVTR